MVVDNPEEHHGHSHHHHPDAHFPGNPNHHHHGPDQTDHTADHATHTHPVGSTVVTKSEHVDTSHRSSSTTQTGPSGQVVHTYSAPAVRTVAVYRSAPVYYYPAYDRSGHLYRYDLDPSNDPVFRETVRG